METRGNKRKAVQSANESPSRKRRGTIISPDEPLQPKREATAIYVGPVPTKTLARRSTKKAPVKRTGRTQANRTIRPKKPQNPAPPILPVEYVKPYGARIIQATQHAYANPISPSTVAIGEAAEALMAIDMATASEMSMSRSVSPSSPAAVAPTSAPRFPGPGKGEAKRRIAAYNWGLRLINQRRNVFAVAQEYFTRPPHTRPAYTQYPSLGRRLRSISQRKGKWENFDTQYVYSYKGIGDHDKATMPAAMQRKWLDSEKGWNMKLGGMMDRDENGKQVWISGWRGVKLLGMGGNGLVGLWEREDWWEEGDEDEFHIPKEVKRVVVKQQRPGRLTDFEEECGFMEAFQGKTKHVIQMFASSVDELGQGSYEGARRNGFDPLGEPVQRVFLDYCDGGDMDDYSRKLYADYSADEPIPEKMIWKLFLCLAQGCAVLEDGTDDMEEENVFGENLNCVHFDMKNENVFIKTDDDEHTDTPLLVIGDLGLMEIVDKPPMPKDDYLNLKSRGTFTSLPPEQYESQYHEDFGIEEYLGTAMNIWGIGKIMHHLITRARECNPEAYLTDSQPYRYIWTQLDTEDSSSWMFTQGALLLEAPYSYQLRRTVLKCLALDWRKRPNGRELIGVIMEVLEAIEESEDLLRDGNESDLEMNLELQRARENLRRSQR